ncbi:MAG: adenylate/guanylate cyclase domain-containing protein [Desulfobacteraceae bacterium]|nr:MAG: adenylate/guanylate cyclase domain-containing protein [Desulfobacteraceae bacterium]
MLPWREFKEDLLSWALIGFLIAGFYMFNYQAPLPTGIKILLGCSCFGLFGGMFSFLVMERKIILTLRAAKRRISVSPKGFLSVSNKMLFFVIAVLLFMVAAILLMVFMDINYMIDHPEKLDPEIYMSVFNEIVFAFGVLMAMSLVIIGYYSKNLKTILSMQLETLNHITKGQYHSMVPVVTNDEFGIIAAKTNEMIKGLKERDFCQYAFDKYMAPEVSRKILSEELPREGEKRVVTILFCDLRGYTSLAEGKDPKEIVAVLNEYFSEMEKAIRANKGIVLQYIGDEIEAVFGAPFDLPDHPDRAVAAALEMRGRLQRLNDKKTSLGLPGIRHGIGIHTGEVLAGSVGSRDRLVYAMVGDTVNTASRIQTLNKEYGTDILISGKTRELLTKDYGSISAMGGALLRGRKEEVQIFKVE